MECNRRNLRILSMAGSRGACAKALYEAVEEKRDCLILTADLATLSGLEHLAEKYPEQLINVGIAEQNLIGVASGLAKDGWNVFATTYANFITMRSFEQVRVNLGYMGFPVKVIGCSGGLGMGVLGNTHYAIEDIALMRTIPGMTVLSPTDGWETVKAVKALIEYKQPVYLRLSGEMNQPIVYQEDYDFKIGHIVKLREGDDIVIFATGTMVAQALKTAVLLSENGVEAEVVNVHTIKPLDADEIRREVTGKKMFVTAEEHTIRGGLGSAVLEVLADEPLCPGLLLGIPDCFLKAGSYEYLLEQCGLTESQMADRILAKYQEKTKGRSK